MVVEISSQGLRRVAAAVLIAWAGASHAAAGDHMALALVSDSPTVAAGGQVWLGIEERPTAGWHTYWRNPGDTGEAPDIAWSLPGGATIGTLHYPAPQRLAYPGVVTYGYDHPVVLLTRLTVPATAIAGSAFPVHAHVSTLVCADTCEPVDADVTTTLRVGPPHPGRLAAALAAVPVPLAVAMTWDARTDPTLSLTAPAGVNLAVGGETYLFPQSDHLWPAGVDEVVSTDGHVLNIKLHGWHAWPASSTTAVLRLGDGRAFQVALAAQPASPAWALAGALVLALAGGLVLNLMPCVFPILSMKLLAITRAGHDRGMARLEALSYFTGAVLSFVALALALEAARAMGQAVGWGFQLQSPVVTAGLSLVLLLVGLNLSGLFEIGGGLQALAGGVAIEGKGRLVTLAGAALTGVLAVVVAAPCTAPFMATAVGFAVTHGGWMSVLVFVALGCGFAAPFVLLTLLFTSVPALARFLPRPGPWMDMLRKGLAVPMYLATLWMVWVFAQQAGVIATAVLFVALAAIVLALLARALPAHWRGLALVAVIGLTLGGGGAVVAHFHRPSGTEAPGPAGHETFSPGRLAQLRAQGRPVFVDLTAAWCVTCKVNEQLVLKNPRVAQALARTGTAWMVGDWTRRDAAITGYLGGFGRSGVPLYVLYRPGAGPRILPQLLNVDAVIAAVDGH